jgi:hypothetical protein
LFTFFFSRRGTRPQQQQQQQGVVLVGFQCSSFQQQTGAAESRAFFPSLSQHRRHSADSSKFNAHLYIYDYSQFSIYHLGFQLIVHPFIHLLYLWTLVLSNRPPTPLHPSERVKTKKNDDEE